MDIGKKIRQLRLQNDLTLEDLASRSELTKGFLSQLERNLTSPSISTLEDILEALGTNLSEFFREEEEEQIVQLFEKNGRAKDLVLFNCTSGYPVPFADICLLEIERMQN